MGPDSYNSYDSYEERAIGQIFNPPIDMHGERYFRPDADTGDLPMGTEPERLTVAEISGLLRGLSMSIQLQMANRDHLLVRQCPGLIVFRPYDGAQDLSRGVEAEVGNWVMLQWAERAFPPQPRRTYVSINTSEELAALQLSHADHVDVVGKLCKEIEMLVNKRLNSQLFDNVRFLDPHWLQLLLGKGDSALSSGRISPADVRVIKGQEEELILAVEGWIKMPMLRRVMRVQDGVPVDRLHQITLVDYRKSMERDLDRRQQYWLEVVNEVRTAFFPVDAP